MREETELDFQYDLLESAVFNWKQHLKYANLENY